MGAEDYTNARDRLEAGHEIAYLSRRQLGSPGEPDGHVDVAAGVGGSTASRSEDEGVGDPRIGVEHGAQPIDHEGQCSTADVEGRSRCTRQHALSTSASATPGVGMTGVIP